MCSRTSFVFKFSTFKCGKCFGFVCLFWWKGNFQLLQYCKWPVESTFKKNKLSHSVAFSWWICGFFFKSKVSFRPAFKLVSKQFTGDLPQNASSKPHSCPCGSSTCDKTQRLIADRSFVWPVIKQASSWELVHKALNSEVILGTESNVGWKRSGSGIGRPSASFYLNLVLLRK